MFSWLSSSSARRPFWSNIKCHCASETLKLDRQTMWNFKGICAIKNEKQTFTYRSNALSFQFASHLCSRSKINHLKNFFKNIFLLRALVVFWNTSSTPPRFRRFFAFALKFCLLQPTNHISSFCDVRQDFGSRRLFTKFSPKKFVFSQNSRVYNCLKTKKMLDKRCRDVSAEVHIVFFVYSRIWVRVFSC